MQRMHEFTNIGEAREFLAGMDKNFVKAFKVHQKITAGYSTEFRPVKNAAGKVTDMIYVGADTYTISFSVPAAMSGNMPDRTDVGPLE